MSLQPVGFLRGQTLTQDEELLLQRMQGVLWSARGHNERKAAAYEAKRLSPTLGISIPPQFRQFETVVGWPGLVVDVLEERLDLEGIAYVNADSSELTQIVNDNHLLTESNLANLDALIYGISFLVAGTGFDNEPDPLVTVESPMRMTCLTDRRTRRVRAAASFAGPLEMGPARLQDEVDERTATLYLPDVTVTVSHDSGGWKVVDRDEHNLGRVPVARLINRPRLSDTYGRSEITRAVLSTTDQAVRALLGMDISREFYAAPQRYILGADESAFQDANGNPKDTWSTYRGRVLALTRDENGDVPSVGQFPAASPAPFLDELRGLAQLLAGEAGMPASHLGLVTENPPSADGIRASEARLVKRAERRQRMFGAAYTEIMKLALWVRDGRQPNVPEMHVMWTDASTPTRAAQADAAVKLVGAEILPPNSPVTYRQVGLSSQDQQQLAQDARRSTVTTSLTAVQEAAQRVRSEDPQAAALAARQIAQ